MRQKGAPPQSSIDNYNKKENISKWSVGPYTSGGDGQLVEIVNGGARHSFESFHFSSPHSGPGVESINLHHGKVALCLW